MKYLNKILSVLVIGLFITGVLFAAADKYKIIDTMDGKKGKRPKWLAKGMTMSKLEKEYNGKYAFVIRSKGDNLNFIENWAKRISAGSEVANLISQQVRDIAAGSQYGTDASFQQTMETLTTSISKARIAGLRREADWWELKQYTSGTQKGKKEYEYMVLFLIDKDTIDKMINNEVEKALTGANAETKARVTEAVDDMILESGGEE